MTLTLRDSQRNVVSSATGPSILHPVKTVTSGTYTYEVSGSDRGSFNLKVVHH